MCGSGSGGTNEDSGSGVLARAYHVSTPTEKSIDRQTHQSGSNSPPGPYFDFIHSKDPNSL